MMFKVLVVVVATFCAHESLGEKMDSGARRIGRAQTEHRSRLRAAANTWRVGQTSDEEKTDCECSGWEQRWHGIGKKTPECCAKFTVEVVHSLSKHLEENNFKYALSGGSLLGCVRAGGFIPYDYDADIEVYVSDQIKFKKVIEKWAESGTGYKLRQKMTISVGGLAFVGDGWGNWPQEGEKKKLGDVHIDIGIVDLKDSDATEKLPREQCVFEGRLSWVPNDWQERLSDKYGNAFEIPRRWCNWATHKLCDEVDKKEQTRLGRHIDVLRKHWCADGSKHGGLIIGVGKKAPKGGCSLKNIKPTGNGDDNSKSGDNSRSKKMVMRRIPDEIGIVVDAANDKGISEVQIVKTLTQSSSADVVTADSSGLYSQQHGKF